MRTLTLFVIIGAIAAGCGGSGAESDAGAVSDSGGAGADGATDGGTGVDAAPADAGADAGPACAAPDAGFPAVPLDSDPVFVKGPYLMYTSPTSVVVKWETAGGGAGTATVEYGLADPPDAEATGNSTGPADGDSGTVHEVHVTGLAPGTAYHYRAGDGTTWSGVHAFHTAAPHGTPFRFAAIGDTQSHPEIHGRLIPPMAAWGPSLVLHVGDEIGDGTVAAQWQTEFYDVIRPLAHRIPYFVAIGNHERDSPLFYRFVSYPTPAVTYYTFVWGDVFFIAIDSNKYLFGTADPQHEWVVTQLGSAEAEAAKWRVAFFHEPAYSESWGGCTFNGNPAIRSALVPALERGGVNLVINGHTHEYERGLLNGVYHIISGGGGGDLETDWCVDYPQITVRRSVHHFLALEAACDALTVKAIDIDGDEFDSISIPPGFPVVPDGGTDTDGRVVWDAGAPDAGDTDAGHGGDL